jgi:YgiT-type zinc finger domain-containing protein
MRCVFCGGDLKESLVTFAYNEDDKYIFIEHVPAFVCEKCGEKAYSPEVTDELLKLAREECKPIKTIKVPVYDYVHHKK